ncbi:MAG: protein phosphatase 2C domain-containing protein [Chloroflexota bacterium]
MRGILNRVFSILSRQESNHIESSSSEHSYVDDSNLDNIDNARCGRLSFESFTHKGRVRSQNEDSCVAIGGTSFGEQRNRQGALFILADGMGGYEGGSRASMRASDIVSDRLAPSVLAPFLFGSQAPSDSITDLMTQAVHDANNTVREEMQGSGTTVSTVLLLGDWMYLAHVGDSRVYIHVDGKKNLELLSEDHSLVQRLISTGQIDADEAVLHPQRNVLYQAIGQDSRLSVQTLAKKVPERGWILLCSDGLWGHVKDDDIAFVLNDSNSVIDAGNRLVNLALDAGGTDNISVILAHLT